MSRDLVITPVEGAAERTEFIHFQWDVYKGDPYWVPPLLSEREKFFDPVDGHPFHRHAKMRYFLARRDGKPVGRIAAFINYRHNDYWDERSGFFGHFEVLEDREAAEALLKAAEDFVRSEGMTALRGPMNFSTNEEIGLLVEGWNGPPTVMMTYNPRYYVDFIEKAGYGKVMDVLAYNTDLTQYKADGTGINPKLLRVARKVKERYDISVRPVDMRNFDREADIIKEVYHQAWSKNWGFVPLTDAEMDNLAHEIKQFMDPRVTFIAEKGGRPIAFMLPFPDLCQPLIKAYPRPGEPELWTMAKLLYWWKLRGTITTIRAALGGIVEEYRGRGVDAVLFMETLLAALKRGYKRLEMSWVLETNLPMRQTADIFDGELYRRYRIYEKPV
jgi:GNAT superfamily N-acetyltransferase